VVWPNKWLVGFAKAKDVKPGDSQELTIEFGSPEIARWGAEGFVIVSGQYLLTTIDQRGRAAANLTLTVP
jgi:hypothetical protein